MLTVTGGTTTTTTQTRSHTNSPSRPQEWTKNGKCSWNKTGCHTYTSTWSLFIPGPFTQDLQCWPTKKSSFTHTPSNLSALEDQPIPYSSRRCMRKTPPCTKPGYKEPTSCQGNKYMHHYNGKMNRVFSCDASLANDQMKSFCSDHKPHYNNSIKKHVYEITK